MIQGKKIVAIIPARGGSKRIPHKNIKLLAGKPLLSYSIDAAIQCRLVDRIIVSTDDPKIAKVARFDGAEVFMRPREISQDESSTEDVLINVAGRLEEEKYFPDYIVLLQPTSPLRDAPIINKGIKMIVEADADSLVSVCEIQHYYLAGHFEGEDYKLEYNKRPFSQKMPKKFRENGALYITGRDFLLKERNRIGGRIKALIMNEVDSIDIDEPSDFEIVERIIKGKYRGKDKD